MIVGVHPQGCDDRGRPGALAFHALFVGPWAYRWIGADPFAFAGVLRGDWSAGRPRSNPARGHLDRQWNRARMPVDHRRTTIRDWPDRSGTDQGRRVVVQSAEPIDGLARDVWRTLPRSVRRRATVATWAFDNANRFDLVALPKLAGVALDASDLVLALEHAGR